MNHLTDAVRFSLEDVLNSAGNVLAMAPDGVLAYRLKREVLRLPAEEPELIRLKNGVMKSKWVHQLDEAQLPDGSWGRFHSQNTK
jgi:hypothetical protein